MGLWSAYFLAKIMLYAHGYMDFSPWMNLAFAVFTALAPKNSRQRFAKNLIAVPLGILLLYHDSWLPPITQAVLQLTNLRDFRSAYLWELAARIISWKLLFELALMFAFYALARRKLRMSTFVFIGIFALMLAPHGQLWPGAAPSTAAALATTRQAAVVIDTSPQALDARLAQFYAEQKSTQTQFNRPSAQDMPYDILLLHVCSLSWDDLKRVHLEPDAFFGRFEVVLSSFNSAASYSGPAAIRLLRGACGQTPENKLYDAAGNECLVMDGLQNAGFEAHWLMNHDGHFGNFFGDVRDRGGLSVALENTVGATPAQLSFDGTRIYSDYSVLSRWWAKRQSNPVARVALYYNTISLHDGNRVIGAGRDSSYGARWAQLSSDISRFLDDLRKSGRRVIVVFVAEHGAALGGDRRQISGLREIPTAAIAHVPVAIALVNTGGTQQVPQQRIDDPVSYRAVSELLSRFIATSPYEKPDTGLDSYVQGLPRAEFVAENNGTTVVQVGAGYMMRSPDGAWSTLE